MPRGLPTTRATSTATKTVSAPSAEKENRRRETPALARAKADNTEQEREGVETGAVEAHEDDDRYDVVGDRQRHEEDPQASGRVSPDKGQRTDGEGDIGGHRDPPRP